MLYGLGTAPARQALAAGAVPVLVEGPLDAIAVTWSHPDPAPDHSAAGRRPPRYVGVAPCGTALTAAQVAVLQTHAGPLSKRGVGTAFDHDPAGAQAGLRAFELLRAAGAWPTAAALPAGLDPADLTTQRGPAALSAALAAAGPLADLVVDAHLEPWTGRLHWAEGRTGAARAAAHLLATFPPTQVGRQVHRVAGRLGLEHSELTGALLEAISAEGPQAAPHPVRTATAPADQPAPDLARLARASYPRDLTGRTGPGPPPRAGPPAEPSRPVPSSTASRRTPPLTASTSDRATRR